MSVGSSVMALPGNQGEPDNHQKAKYLVLTVANGEQDASAEKTYRWALSLWPEYDEALNGMARCAMGRGANQEALEWLEKVLAVNPKDPAFLTNMSSCYQRQGKLDLAEEYLRKAWAVDYGNPVTASCYGDLLMEQERFDEIEKIVAEALVMHPKSSALYFGLGMANLIRGNWEKGWKGWKARESRFDITKIMAKAFPTATEWELEPLEGKSILVIPEHGLGDQIMFARHLHEIFALNPETVSVHIRNELRRLFELSWPGIKTYSEDDDVPNPDYWIGMAGLPHLLRHSAPEPSDAYLKADPGDRRRYRDTLSTDGATFRVGICWRGNPKAYHDLKRSCPWEDFATIVKPIPGVKFYNLIPDEDCPDQGVDNGPIHTVTDMADTAALVENLDLVITICTSIVHLAGALNVPVVIMRSRPYEWRWGLTGEQLWYKSATLLRQEKRGVWGPLAAQAREILEQRVANANANQA